MGSYSRASFVLPPKVMCQTKVKLHMISLLTGKALTWATAVWDKGGESLSSYEQQALYFTECSMMDQSGRRWENVSFPLTKGVSEEYALAFRTLATESG